MRDANSMMRDVRYDILTEVDEAMRVSPRHRGRAEMVRAAIREALRKRRSGPEPLHEIIRRVASHSVDRYARTVPAGDVEVEHEPEYVRNSVSFPQGGWI